MEDVTTTVLHEPHHSGGGTKEVIRVTIILSVLTIIELALGFFLMTIPLNEETKRLAIKGVIIILMLAKAFYIVGYFMHLKHEVRNLIMTICVPLCLFIWFLIAFLSDGHSYNELRNRYNPEYKERTSQQAPKQEEPKPTSPEKQ